MNFLGWVKNEDNLAVLRTLQILLLMPAIVVGGIWTYPIFVKRRQRYPRANVTQQIGHYPLLNNKVLLRATVRICNEGEILLSLVSGFSRVQQMIPCEDDLCKVLEGRD